MKKTTFQDLLTDPNSRLSQWAHKVNQIQELNQHLKTLLPAPLSEHCWVANFRDGILIIATANSHWLTRLRFENAHLLSSIQKKYPAYRIQKIECKVMPDIKPF